LSIKSKVFAAAAVLTLAGGVAAAAGTAHASVEGSRATNANVNPVAGYVAVGNGPNVNFDHVETYAGAQDNIGDLALGLGNGAGIGLAQTNFGGSTGSVVQTGIIQVSPGVYQVAFGAGIVGPPPAAAKTNNDNAEDGALGNYITGSPAHSALCPNTDAVSGVYAQKAPLTGTTLICTIGATFSLAQVQELDLQYLHGEADFSVQNITGDNPGGWDTTGWFPVSTYIGGDISFNEAVTGADADASTLTPPASRTLFPAAHATVSSFGHKDSGFFDTGKYWTAIPVSSYPNGNTSDGAVLAPTVMKDGNYSVLEGAISS
jgi:hypothetical protein